MSEPDNLQQRMKRFKDGLRRAGVKQTHQRLEVFREVARSGGHPDAATVYKSIRKRVPTISLDTVYRTLWLLLDLGLISTLGFPRGRARFDANLSSHHHFVCLKCGLTRDFHSEKLDHLKLPSSVKALGSAEKMQVEVRGVCLPCSKRKGKPG